MRATDALRAATAYAVKTLCVKNAEELGRDEMATDSLSVNCHVRNW